MYSTMVRYSGTKMQGGKIDGGGGDEVKRGIDYCLNVFVCGCSVDVETRESGYVCWHSRMGCCREASRGIVERARLHRR